MDLAPILLAPALLGLLAGCVPAGDNPGSAGGFASGGRSVPEPQLEGWEIQELVSDGSFYMEWTDPYVECGYFHPNGNFESYGYYPVSDGLLHEDGPYDDNWHVSGNQLCMRQACYYAEWRQGEMWLQYDDASYAAYMTLFDGPGQYFQSNCGIG